MIRHTIAILFVITIALFGGGCPLVKDTSLPREEPTPEQLFQKGQTLFEQKKYLQAIEVWEGLKSAHPDFGKMPELYMKLADASFEQGTYEDARARYKECIELYPSHQDIVRAKYMVGMSYYNEIKSIDLDSTALINAADEFASIKDASSNDEWKKKADEKYRECRKKLGQKELLKATEYLSKKQYKPASIAAQRVVDEFKDLGLDDQAKAILDRTKDKVKDTVDKTKGKE